MIDSVHDQPRWLRRRDSGGTRNHLRDWSFRTRLIASIAAVFILGGAALVGAQYLIVRNLLQQQVTTSASVMRFQSGINTDAELILIGEIDGVNIIDGIDGWQGMVRQVIGETAAATAQTISAEVQTQLLAWSLVILGIFALAAVAAGWLISRGPLRRISFVTTTAQAVSAANLSARLALPGPNDEIKALGDTFDGMLDRIQEAFTRQDRFIAGASHELRTPLTAARAALEIPLAQGRIPADLEPAIRKSLAANERADLLLNGLLSLAQARQPRQRADVSMDLTELTESLLAEAGRAGVVVQNDAPNAAISKELATIAISNLIDNAQKYGTNARISTGTASNFAYFEISSEGADLTEIDVDQFKEPFQRGAQTRLAGGGLGLGLALVDSIATLSGGSLQLRANPGGGLTARLALPSRRAG